MRLDAGARQTQEELLAVVVRGAKHRAVAGAGGLDEAGGGLSGEHDGSGARAHGGRRVDVAVDVLAREGDEDRAILDLARIDDDIARKGAAILNQLRP